MTVGAVRPCWEWLEESLLSWLTLAVPQSSTLLLLAFVTWHQDLRDTRPGWTGQSWSIQAAHVKALFIQQVESQAGCSLPVPGTDC